MEFESYHYCGPKKDVKIMHRYKTNWKSKSNNFLKLTCIAEMAVGQLLNTVATQSEQTVNIGLAEKTTCRL